MEQVIDMLIRYWLDRPAALQALDEKREADPQWFLSEEMAGIVLYVDLFSNNLAELKNPLPHFEKLEITYQQLMPLFIVQMLK